VKPPPITMLIRVQLSDTCPRLHPPQRCSVALVDLFSSLSHIRNGIQHGRVRCCWNLSAPCRVTPSKWINTCELLFVAASACCCASNLLCLFCFVLLCCRVFYSLSGSSLDDTILQLRAMSVATPKHNIPTYSYFQFVGYKSSYIVLDLVVMTSDPTQYLVPTVQWTSIEYRSC
jgi:hypothetical protein